MEYGLRTMFLVSFFIRGETMKLQELRQLVSYHNKKYYDDNEPEISDEQYDRLFHQLIQLEAKNPYDKDNITFKVSEKSTSYLKQVTRDKPMLSIFTEVQVNEEAIEKFHERIRQETSDEIFYTAEFKYDGLAIELIYDENDQLIDIATRGDGFKGDSVMHAFARFKSIPSVLNEALKGVKAMRGEAVITKKTLIAVNEARTSLNLKPYINCRNAVAGMLRSTTWEYDDPSINIVFLPYSVVERDEIDQTSLRNFQSGILSIFVTENLLPDIYTIRTNKTSDLWKYYQTVLSIRDKLGFDIDGVVYKVDSIKTQNQLGVTGREPRWAMAHKFTATKAVTKLLGIDVQVGKSGRVTPVARLQPVFVHGTTITNVTLSNVFQIRKKGIRVGDMVVVQRAGDVIPEILTPADGNVRASYVPNFRMPKLCPCCSEPIDRPIGYTYYTCTNYNCSDQIEGKMVNFASRSCLNIEGFGPATAKLLIEHGYTKLSDILALTQVKMIQMGLGPIESKNLMDSIISVKSTPVTLAKVIESLSISSIGQRASEKIAEHFKTFDKFVAAELKDLKPLTGLGVGLVINNVRELNAYLSRNRREAFTVLSQFTYKSLADKGVLSGKVFCVTGSDPDFERQTIKDAVERLGGKFTASLTKQVNVLLYGQNPSGKLDKAKSSGIEVLSISEGWKKYLSVN